MWTGWVVLVERICGSETVLMGEDLGLWCRLRNSELRSIWVWRDTDKSDGRPPNSSGMSWQTDLRWTTRSFEIDSLLARSLPSVDEYRARGDDARGSVCGPPRTAPRCSGLSRRRLILQLPSLSAACINRKQTTVPTSFTTSKNMYLVDHQRVFSCSAQVAFITINGQLSGVPVYIGATTCSI